MKFRPGLWTFYLRIKKILERNNHKLLPSSPIIRNETKDLDEAEKIVVVVRCGK